MFARPVVTKPSILAIECHMTHFATRLETLFTRIFYMNKCNYIRKTSATVILIMIVCVTGTQPLTDYVVDDLDNVVMPGNGKILQTVLNILAFLMFPFMMLD